MGFFEIGIVAMVVFVFLMMIDHGKFTLKDVGLLLSKYSKLLRAETSRAGFRPAIKPSSQPEP